MSLFGRYQVPEAPSAMLRLHVRRPEFDLRAFPLREVDHEPRVAVLDQSDLHAQGIFCSRFIPGAGDPDALGSCTANTVVEALSNTMSETDFAKFVGSTMTMPYSPTGAAETAAIRFYHECTDQTADPSQEWPPTDCGSSGPYLYSEALRQGLIGSERIAHGADNIVSLLQAGGALLGTPWLNDWMTPTPDGFIDGDGKLSTVESQIQYGVAGGHEVYVSAIEKLVLYPHGDVNPWHTVIRLRNHWTRSWGDQGSCRAHLSTFSHILGAYVDVRQFRA